MIRRLLSCIESSKFEGSLKLLVIGIAAELFCVGLQGATASKVFTVTSPDGRLAVEFKLDDSGAPRYAIRLAGQPVLAESRLGLVREDTDLSTGLRLLAASRRAESVRDRYEILTAKRRLNEYRANRKSFRLENAARQLIDIDFQVSNDGVAFQYYMPGRGLTKHRLKDELTSYRFLPGSRAWLQPIGVARSGWEKTQPSYEEYYEKDIPVGTPSPTGAGWVYPALFRSGDTWLLISESSVGRNYCGTRLRSDSPEGEYRVGFADPRETVFGGPANPESTLPWRTPWRVIVVGSLKTIAESMLGVDVAEKPAKSAPALSQPGKASWSWCLLKDQHTVYDEQKRFIDYAADMGWRYTLIDAFWDTQIGYDKMTDLVKYATGKSVKVLLWYNSAGDWNTAPLTPRSRLLTHEDRVKEFSRLKEMGVAGLKIDFFGGDGQSVMNYYQDLLQDAAQYGFVVNFHGCTLPRGWQRTYPNLMTMEAVRGMEYVTFEQSNADQEPTHAAMLPFTRNVFDPMDFTPVALDRVPGIQRRTTSAFELALSVLFTSGITHYAEIPEGMAKAPDYVREFMKRAPSVWDETKFIDGFPGRFVVMARRGEGRWYVAGINGEATAVRLPLDLGQLGAPIRGTLIADGDEGNLSFRQQPVNLAPGQKLDIALPAYGGFVLVVE